MGCIKTIFDLFIISVGITKNKMFHIDVSSSQAMPPEKYFTSIGIEINFCINVTKRTSTIFQFVILFYISCNTVYLNIYSNTKKTGKKL